MLTLKQSRGSGQARLRSALVRCPPLRSLFASHTCRPLVTGCSSHDFAPISLLQIRFFLLQNRQGKTRLSKWYVAIEEADKRKIENEVHRLVTARDSKFTNFVEFRTYKIIYRRYAGLFFSFCVDVTDNELSYLEGIHLFVEMLDRYFGNVCELDLVFNFHKVCLPLYIHKRDGASAACL
jgi:AP-2 complex subunit sigma-1